MGNQITDSAFLTDQDDIEAEIDTLSYTGEDTDLYSGLLHGLKFLQQGEEVHEMKTLVVISDGCDDQGAGATWKEAYEAVGKAGIPCTQQQSSFLQQTMNQPRSWEALRGIPLAAYIFLNLLTEVPNLPT